MPEEAHKDPQAALTPLFREAKNTDEFEYCCTLLRLRGLDFQRLDPLLETSDLSRQLTRLLDAPIDPTLRLRLGLFLYCHLSEADDPPRIVANLLRVVQGQRYTLDPFAGVVHSSGQDARSPLARALRVAEWADSQGFSDLAAVYRAFILRPVRNAFFHSDYVVTDALFHIKHGEMVEIDGSPTRDVPLAWLVPRLNLGIDVVLGVINLAIEGLRSYSENKLVRGRFASDGSFMDIELTTREGVGLVGFRSPPQKLETA
jgi:hypothetical protein